jgi:hypothetical protein
MIKTKRKVREFEFWLLLGAGVGVRFPAQHVDDGLRPLLRLLRLRTPLEAVRNLFVRVPVRILTLECVKFALGIFLSEFFCPLFSCSFPPFFDSVIVFRSLY